LLFSLPFGIEFLLVLHIHVHFSIHTVFASFGREHANPNDDQTS